MLTEVSCDSQQTLDLNLEFKTFDDLKTLKFNIVANGKMKKCHYLQNG